MFMKKNKIAIAYTSLDDQLNAEQLSQKLALAIADDLFEYEMILMLKNAELELQFSQQNYKPFKIDFSQAQLDYRRQHAKLKNELLLKAIGLKTLKQPKIIDATAGLGRDAFLMASFGCDVTLIERSAILVELLKQAIKTLDDKVIKMDLIHADAIHFLQALPLKHYPDVIYIDPMFPERKKSALVKKEMLILKSLVGEDEDAINLFNIALQRAKKRVVVKRPAYAPIISNRKPEIQYKGRSVRFDVYTHLK